MAKILIAEDERDIRDLITFTLRFAGHEVVAAANGEEALEKALQEKRCRLQPAPTETLLDLHFALHIRRRANSSSSAEFLGRTWKIAATRSQSVLIIHHPDKHSWVVPPSKSISNWPHVPALYSL